MRDRLTAAEFPFLAELSEAGRDALGRLPIRQAAARQPVLARGDAVEGVYLVTRGALRVYHVTPEGREATLYLVEPGETCILALTASFRSERYPAWVETDRDPVSFVLVPGATFRALFGSEPAFREFVFEVLSRRVFELMVALEETGSLRVEQRIAAFLLRRAGEGDVVRVTQERLAAHLGSAREVVFRALRSLVASGCVDTRRGEIRIVDRTRLASMVHEAAPRSGSEA